jgi:patatin-related protein
VRELRLGLVCYGGVSLTIYMHGMTKEIHRALRASVLAERGLEPDEAAKSEQVYNELLAEVAGESGDTRTRIVVDTIAGSSAGGINGIFLAKALAHDLSQDTLRDLWFVHGDLGKIVRPADIPGPDLFVDKPAKKAVEELIEQLLPDDAGDIPSARTWADIAFAAIGVAGGAESILDGKQMTHRVYEALHGMEPASPRLGSLMPEGHPLSLAVTVTDYGGYRRFLPATDPDALAEGQHRHLLEFRYDGKDDFDSTHDDALTMAARATSSLPLGFEPVNPRTFPSTLPEGSGSSLESLKPYFRSYTLSEADPARSYFLDGGVLDNKPFGPVIKAIKERPAGTEVDRYLVFLEPDPHPPDEGTRELEKDPEKDPPPLKLVLGALSGLPRSEPILEELHGVLVRNQRVRAVQDVITTNWNAVATLVGELLPAIDSPPPASDLDQLREWNRKIHTEAERLTQLGQPAYVRLKISSAIDSFGKAACLVCDYTDSSNQAYLVQEILRAWARDRGLFKQSDEAEESKRWQPTDEQRDFVEGFDLAFSERRLRFVIAGVNWLYRDVGKQDHPSREELDAVKRRLYDAVEELQQLSSGSAFSDEVGQGIGACFEEKRVNQYLADHKLDVKAFLEDPGNRKRLDDLNASLRSFLGSKWPPIAPRLYGNLVDLTDDWNKDVRRKLLVRYLGFPIWDALLYPVQALSEVAEGDELRVMRLSPLDSTEVSPPLGGPKVQGAALGHAFAFFSREARENDYLWGRLDAAERMVRLLLTRYVSKEEDGRTIVVRESGEKHARYKHWCSRVMLAVIDEDGAKLEKIPATVADLRRQVERLGQPAAATPHR